MTTRWVWRGEVIGQNRHRVDEASLKFITSSANVWKIKAVDNAGEKWSDHACKCKCQKREVVVGWSATLLLTSFQEYKHKEGTLTDDLLGKHFTPHWQSCICWKFTRQKRSCYHSDGLCSKVVLALRGAADRRKHTAEGFRALQKLEKANIIVSVRRMIVIQLHKVQQHLSNCVISSSSPRWERIPFRLNPNWVWMSTHPTFLSLSLSLSTSLSLYISLTLPHSLSDSDYLHRPAAEMWVLHLFLIIYKPLKSLNMFFF